MLIVSRNENVRQPDSSNIKGEAEAVACKKDATSWIFLLSTLNALARLSRKVILQKRRKNNCGNYQSSSPVGIHFYRIVNISETHSFA